MASYKETLALARARGEELHAAQQPKRHPVVSREQQVQDAHAWLAGVLPNHVMRHFMVGRTEEDFMEVPVPFGLDPSVAEEAAMLIDEVFHAETTERRWFPDPVPSPRDVVYVLRLLVRTSD
jgi:hypothetical protein